MEYVPKLDEQAVYRAVTGAAYNMLYPDGSIIKGDGTAGSGQQFPAKGTIPIARQYSGLVSSTGKNVRVNVDGNFNQLKAGDYLYDGDVLRQIDYITSDKLLVLKEAFPSDLTDDLLLVCERQFFRYIKAKSTHASAAAILQEAPFIAADEFSNDGAPISYDAGSGQISFTCHK